MKKFTTLLLLLTIAACNLQDLGNYSPYAAIQQPAPSTTPTATDEPGATATAAATAARSCIVTVAEALHLRRGPGTSYAVIDWLQAGEVLTIRTQRGAWLQVTTAAGVPGWVNGTYCER